MKIAGVKVNTGIQFIGGAIKIAFGTAKFCEIAGIGTAAGTKVLTSTAGKALGVAGGVV